MVECLFKMSKGFRLCVVFFFVCLVWFGSLAARAAIEFYLIKVHTNVAHLTYTRHDNDRAHSRGTHQFGAFFFNDCYSFGSDEIVWKSGGITGALCQGRKMSCDAH